MTRTLGAVVAVVATAIFALWSTFPAEGEMPERAGSVVRVFHSTGHGSAVHIGAGYIVTAAHVISGKSGIRIKDDEGRESGVSVLWANTDYDVALLFTDAPERLEVSALACRSPKPGETLEARGNPMKLEFARIWGRVAGEPIKLAKWQVAVPLDMTVAPGISGGPMLDQSGKVVGIVVGASVYSLGMAPALVPIGYGVGGDTICHLMGR